MSLPVLDNQRARRTFLDRHLLLRTEPGSAKGPDLQRVLDGLGFVQVDSVNTLARAHDLILWSRRRQYRPNALQRMVGRERAAFEHWTHDASVIPIQFFSMWRLKFARDEARMWAKWDAARRDGWKVQVNDVLRHVDETGPTCSRDVGHGEAKGSSGWWDWHPSKTALEFLWRSGQLAVCHREGFRKYYDLTERVIPGEHLNRRTHDDEIVDWAMSAALARLGFGTSGELAAFFQIVTPEEARIWCAEALASGRIREAAVEMADGSLRRSFVTDETLDCAPALPEPSSRVRLLSPFDPVLRDRARAERLFDFRYRIEIFTPAKKRQYGYYVFPVMQGDRLIGRLDAKREGDGLFVRSFWPEPRVRMGKARVSGLIAELQRVMALSGTKKLDFEKDWLHGREPARRH